jgi:hypothetical protein
MHEVLFINFISVSYKKLSKIRRASASSQISTWSRQHVFKTFIVDAFKDVGFKGHWLSGFKLSRI